MADGGTSLPPGRRANPLDEAEIKRVLNTFVGLDNSVNVVHDPGKNTCFRAPIVEGEPAPEIVFGPDIYPGVNTINPNASLSMRAAAAHEISHYHRWKDTLEIHDQDYSELDEALTSLDATLRFPNDLSVHEIRQLISDAMQRIAMFLNRKGAA